MAAGTMIPLLLSDLKSFTPGTNPNDRYYLTDIGKEGEFYLEGTHTGSAPAADDAVTINSNTIGGNIYRYRRIITDGVIDARWFGATGDGTDQSAAIQAALTTTEGNTIVFDAPAGGNFVINTVTVNVAAGKVLKFLPGNRLSGTATINGGIIDAGYRQFIFDQTLKVAPAGCLNNMVSVMWFGAGVFSDSQPSIQKAVDVVIANSALPKTVYFPRGTYVINAPVIVANYIASAQEYGQSTVLLKGEEPGTNRFSGLAATIIANFKDRFAIGFHIAKSGGIQSLSIVGQYTVPSLTDLTSFFNNNPFSTYGDPTCRDSIYSPYCAVAIDPFRANSFPPDGGYPGNDGAGVPLSTYYTKAPNNSPGSGSSGLYFKDLSISNFTVCMIQSPNGQTQNGEGMIYEDIQVANCKLGFASCQGQEKANSYKNIICWGVTHTLFSNSDYGIVGSAGNVFVDNVNVAGAVSRLFNWSVGGWFPSYFRNIYAESLGSFGNLVSGGITCTVENSLFDFVEPNVSGGYYPQYHISLTREIAFKNCVMRIYGTGLPILINGAGIFEECTFESLPVTRVEENISGADTTQFINCNYSFVPGKLGSREILRGSINQFGSYSLYGDYRLIDAVAEYYNVYGEFALKYHKSREFMNLGTSLAITISGVHREFSFTSVYSSYFVVGEPVMLSNPSQIVVFGGIVTAVNSGTNTITVSYVPASVANGTYVACIYAPIRPFRIIGDVTAGSNQVTNVVDGGFPGSIGDLVDLTEFGGRVRLTSVSGSTYTFNSNALVTKTGATLVTAGAIKYTYNSFNPFAPYPTQITANAVFKKGDTIIDTYQGIRREYICIADGMHDPADGRKAVFALNGNIEYSLSGAGSVTIPQGYVVEGFVLKANANMAAVTIGTTSGGTDISSGVALTANVSKVQDWKSFTDANTTIYFGGISGGTVAIKVIIKSV